MNALLVWYAFLTLMVIILTFYSIKLGYLKALDRWWRFTIFVWGILHVSIMVQLFAIAINSTTNFNAFP